MMKNKLLTLVLALVSIVTNVKSQITPDANNIIYVNKSVGGGNYTGNSWANATHELADALKWAREQYYANNSVFDSQPLQIYVAKGQYKPLYNAADNNYTSYGNRDNSFVLVKNVQIYGGFDPANGITNLSHDRIVPPNAPPAAGSVLSGNLGAVKTYHVVIANGDLGSTILDGFNIVEGAANGGGAITVFNNPILRNEGGGITINEPYSYYNPVTITLNNIRVYGSTALNYGGGIYINSAEEVILNNSNIYANAVNNFGGGIFISDDSFTSITNTDITDNTANVGGGIYNSSAASTFTNINIVGNTVNSYGGGIYNLNSTCTLTNVNIVENTANFGSGIYNESSSPLLTNVSIVGNTANITGGMYNMTSNSTINNSIIWGGISNIAGSSFTAKHSLIEGNNDTNNGNIDATGLNASDIFTDPINGNYTLKDGDLINICSPAINTGSNQLWINVMGTISGTEKDVADNSRIYDFLNNGIIDMGAFEFQGEPFGIQPDSNNIIYVDINVNGGNGTGNSWANAITELSDALLWARKQYNFNNTIFDTQPLHIYVAQGIYRPFYSSHDGDYTEFQHGMNSFVMVKNVQIYGGFDPENNITNLIHNRILPPLQGSVLSGEIQNNNNVYDNARHVVISAGDVGSSLLDGFTITGGNAISADYTTVNGYDVSNQYGGGICNYHSSPSYANISAIENIAYLGGAMYNNNSYPSLTNMNFSGNTANGLGGGIYNTESSPSLMNVSISGNTASSSGGMQNDNSSSPTLTNVSVIGNIANSTGGIGNNYSSPMLTNVCISGNISSDGDYGGIMNNYSFPTLTNVTMIGNSSNGAVEMINSQSSPTINNSIIWGEINNNYGGGGSISHSLIEGSNTTSNGNIDATGINSSILFTDSNNGDYSLASGSPAINAGDNQLWINIAGALNNSIIDLNGNPRLVGGTIDIGAFESSFNTIPTAVCQDITASLDVIGEINITPDDINDGSFDPEGSVFLSLNPINFNCNNLGINNVTLTVEDEDGAVNTCEAVVTVVDITSPNFDTSALPDIVDCVVNSLTSPTATDNCAGTITGSHNATFPITSNSLITWTYNDGNGNTSSQTQNVIIDDVTDPVADVATLSDITAQCEVTSLTAPTATDNCAGAITGTHDAILPITTQGTTLVTWTYNDGNGNTSTQMQNVVIDDVTNPVADVSTLPDITGQCEVTSLTAPTGIDNCAGTITGTHDATLPITTQGTTLVTWTYDDGNGNTSTQTQNVIIDDVTDPVANVTTLSDITAQCEVTSLTAPTATDNCAGAITGTHDAILPITTQGTTLVTWTYDDENGNITNQTQNIIITKILNPIPNLTNLPELIAECELTNLTPPLAYNCSGSIIGTHDATLPITTQGTTLVTWTYDDGNGNTSTQTQNVIIDDVTAPVADVAILSDVTAQCEVTSLTAPTATDNCAGTLTGTHDATLPITTQGTTVVTWTYDDGNGNTSSQTQNIVINDITDPVADVVTLADVTAQCEVTSLTAPTATDNCAGAITGTHDATLPITTQGTTVVTWTYDDGNGNTTTQTQNVVIDDVTDPVADVATLADITAECEVSSLTAPTATDNCAGALSGTHDATLPITTQGTTVVTWTYDDGNGNTTTQTQNVVIDDVTDPVADVATLADITAECEVSSLIAPTATDNCAGALSRTHDATLPITTQGTTVVTWTYDDGNGNTTTQTQNVVIDDVTDPVADLATLADVTAECEVTSLTAPTATDNCAGALSGTHDATLPITTQGTTVVTWTYDDGNGNTTTQTQNVVIDDVTDPVADLATLADVTAECEVTSLTAPTATDNCAGALSGTHDATLPITTQGTTVVTWTYDDGNGNTSTQTQNVMISGPNVGVTQVDDITLKADLTGSDYQWIDCNNNNQILNGETNQTFVATINGNYAVIINNGICSDTSSCFAITTVGMDEILDTELVKVYPNPTNDIVTITSSELLKSIEIQNSLGQKISKFVGVNQTSQELNLPDEPGVYFLKILIKDKFHLVKVIKN